MNKDTLNPYPYKDPQPKQLPNTNLDTLMHQRPQNPKPETTTTLKESPKP